MITVEQDGKDKTLPCCKTCWLEGTDRGINILKVVPIKKED